MSKKCEVIAKESSATSPGCGIKLLAFIFKSIAFIHLHMSTCPASERLTGTTGPKCDCNPFHLRKKNFQFYIDPKKAK